MFTVHGTKKLWKAFVERKVGREDIYCLLVRWQKLDHCMQNNVWRKEAQTVHNFVQGTHAGMQPSGLQGRSVDHTQQMLVPSIPPPGDHPYGSNFQPF